MNIHSIILFLFIQVLGFAQEKTVKDLDKDGVKDTVYLDKEHAIIVCKLSSNSFQSILSKPIETLNDQSGIKETKNGFEFYTDWMRSGYKNQFRFNQKTKKIQLIGMSRYELGNYAHDGSGESSVNLLTNDYIGHWNYCKLNKNDELGELITLPTIKTKMKMSIINLESFNENSYFDYADKCSALYTKYKLMHENSTK